MELMKTAVGRSALLSGVPEEGLDSDNLFKILEVRCLRFQQCCAVDTAAASACGTQAISCCGCMQPCSYLALFFLVYQPS